MEYFALYEAQGKPESDGVTHELIKFPNGHCSIRKVGRDGPLSESMHSSIGPWAEANEVYVAQSELVAKLKGQDTLAPVVIYDIGMGIAANALAAFETWSSLQLDRAIRPLHIFSFENDLSGIELALSSSREFSFLERHGSLAAELLTSGTVTLPDCRGGPGFRWTLVHGDFLKGPSRALAPEIIFYDFYSPAVSPELWSVDAFTRLRSVCGPVTVLVTYVAATAARSALLLAGFAVGQGSQTAAKRETTIAATEVTMLSQPLGREWLGKLSRSSRPLPADVDLQKRKKALETIERLSQFS
ncbi:MAG: hypothetical protein A2X94_05195 [Bdellovibrionales bacterium GWB1_55_8]|nr:MAG: hypothetical protein A2X94_05195 [Bdellovibrionales bacterium GWB1_55_8]